MASTSLDLLLGPHAPDVLAAALAGYGGRLDSLRAATVAVQPTGACVVRYEAIVRRADGSLTPEVLVATTGSTTPAGAAVLEGEHLGERVRVGIWRWPQDPALPALGTAADPSRLAELFAAAGLKTTGQLTIRVRAYRPGRRAVLEVRDDNCTRYVKVVRPSEVADLVTRHALLGERLPVPAVLASDPGGLIVLPRAPGTPLPELIDDGGALPTPETLEAVLDSLPGAITQFGVRRPHLDRVEHYAGILRCTAVTSPADEIRLAALVESFHAAPTHVTPLVPVHGDFYGSQLLADGGAVTGLLDVDTAGSGERIDEWATLLAHLVARGVQSPTARSYASAVLAHAERRVDAGLLRHRIAVGLLGLATGPFRNQQPGWAALTAARIDLAEQWLAATDENPLIHDSPAAHLGART